MITMKTNITTLCASLFLAASVGLHADEPTKSTKSSPEFERMKSLVGTWKGTADMGHGPMDLTIEYKLLAGGSVLEERDFPGTPHEMVTMYYEKGGKLALTHYCVMGNRPGMVLKSSDDKTLSFDFDEMCGIDPAKESHMHALTITFDDADTITSTCKGIIDGKEMPDHPVVLKRVKS